MIAFDVNETLSDMEPLSSRFEAVGAPRHLRAAWFASTLRDGFALTAAGAYADFGQVAHAALKSILSREPRLSRTRTTPRGSFSPECKSCRCIPTYAPGSSSSTHEASGSWR